MGGAVLMKKISVKRLVDRNYRRLYDSILEAEKEIQKFLEGDEKHD